MSATSIYLLSGFALFLILVIPLLRTAAWNFLKTATPIAVNWIKVGLHFIIQAHITVIRNLQPRQKILYELRRERTSRTREE